LICFLNHCPMIFIFFLMSQSPTISPLFPYTTLFRSGFDSTPQNGVAPSGVGAFYEQAVGLFDVVVTNGYGVFAEGDFIGGHGTAHAKARVGVAIVAADKAFDKFVEDVVFFREALAGGVKSDGIWPVLVDHGLEYRCGAVQCLVPADALQGHIAV